jgi:hypothetical protein
MSDETWLAYPWTMEDPETGNMFDMVRFTLKTDGKVAAVDASQQALDDVGLNVMLPLLVDDLRRGIASLDRMTVHSVTLQVDD